MSPRAIILVIYSGVGLLLAVVSFPMIRRWVKPNWIYGFRVPKTVNNPDIWYLANEYAGKRLFVGGILSVVLSAGLYVLAPALDVGVYSLVCAGVLLFMLAIGVIQSFLYLRTL